MVNMMDLIDSAADLLRIGRPAYEAAFALYHGAVIGADTVLAALIAAGYDKTESVIAVLDLALEQR